MSVQEEHDDGEEPYAYIMYIDIGPHHPLYRNAELGVLWGAAGDLLRHVPAGLPLRPGH